MPRYQSRPIRATHCDDVDYWLHEGPQDPGREVVEAEGCAGDVPTGILDASGGMIWRLANRIGYLADN